MSIELLIGYVAFASALGSVLGFTLVCLLAVAVEKWKERTSQGCDCSSCGDDALHACGACRSPAEAETQAAEVADVGQFHVHSGAMSPCPTLDTPWHPDYPHGCRTCGTTVRPHKAKGQDKRCYERELGRKRRAKAKTASRR